MNNEIGNIIDWLTDVATGDTERWYSQSETQLLAEDALKLLKDKLVECRKMNKREKAIAGLKSRLQCHGDENMAGCESCPYKNESSCCKKLDEDILALLEAQRETKVVVCQKCGDEIEVKWDLLLHPDMDAIAKRDAFLAHPPKLDWMHHEEVTKTE